MSVNAHLSRQKVESVLSSAYRQTERQLNFILYFVSKYIVQVVQ